MRIRFVLSSCAISFFFQAEDGIRADLVTGVQTCALPILLMRVIKHGQKVPAKVLAYRKTFAGTFWPCLITRISISAKSASAKIGRASCRERVESAAGEEVLSSKLVGCG